VGSSPTRAAWGGARVRVGAGKCWRGLRARPRGSRERTARGGRFFFFQEAMRESFRIGSFVFLPEILCGAWEQR